MTALVAQQWSPFRAMTGQWQPKGGDRRGTTHHRLQLDPYGAKRFRTPTHKNEFSGEQGSALPAVILDIDGTLQTWGQGADPKVLEYCKKHYDAGHVLIVVTARTHDYDYERSFNWLMRHLPYPFIGPFHRACDDPATPASSSAR